MHCPTPVGALLEKLRIAYYHEVEKRYGYRHRHLDSFWFIHINKTGGTSIKSALRLPWGHHTALEMIDQVGRQDWERRFSFTVVRNPWDRVVSQYHYRVAARQGNIAADGIGFHDWVRAVFREQDPTYRDRPKFFMPQVDWVVGEEEAILVDYVCRYESLADDFRTVCEKIRSRAQLRHLRSSVRGSYRDYYDRQSRDTIAGHFNRDINQFGYDF